MYLPCDFPCSDHVRRGSADEPIYVTRTYDHHNTSMVYAGPIRPGNGGGSDMVEKTPKPKTKKNKKPGSTEGPFICNYCGREFKQWGGLTSHLQACPKRRLRTEFQVGAYEFYVLWNPIRRIHHTLKEIAVEYGRINDYASFVVIMKFLKKAGYIDDYGIEENKEGSPSLSPVSSSSS